MLDDTSMIWFRLRERRSSLRTKSKVDATAARRQTFAAAMAQFEEQFTAARTVTSATRPINLYYGLQAAGTAVAAAHADDPWTSTGHGLHLMERHESLADMMVKPAGSGAFQTVAAATGSPEIAGPVSLRALWATLPDLAEGGLLPGPVKSTVLAISIDLSSTRSPRATLYLPGKMPSGEREWLARFDAIMGAYPSGAPYAIPLEDGAVVAPARPGSNWQVTLRWPAGDSGRDKTEEELENFFVKIAPEYRYRGDRFLRPAIDAAGAVPPSPLMTWWLLLYSFSILTRYEPRRWMKLLDPDSSEVAVLLQYALEHALAAVPQLVLEALDNRPSLLPKTLAF